MRYQVVWWWRSWGLGWARYEGGLASIYLWTLLVGPLEIRRWKPGIAADRLRRARRSSRRDGGGV